MKELERYIVGNVRIREDIEYQFLTFRIIHRASSIIQYVETRVIKGKNIFHGAIEDDMEHILGNYLVLAMHYVSGEQYAKELDNLITYDEKKAAEIDLPPLLGYINNITHTASEILNTMSADKENKFYVTQLILDGIKQCYFLCEFLNINITELRANIFRYKETILCTTTQIMKQRKEGNLPDFTLMDLVIDKGSYIGIKISDGIIDKRHYESGDIIKDFFECTRDLRNQEKEYKYSSKLLEYMKTEDELSQAYIIKGNLRLKSSITAEEIKQYGENIPQFEKDFHHVIVNKDTSSMDDFLDYLYSK